MSLFRTQLDFLFLAGKQKNKMSNIYFGRTADMNAKIIKRNPRREVLSHMLLWKSQRVKDTLEHTTTQTHTEDSGAPFFSLATSVVIHLNDQELH